MNSLLKCLICHNILEQPVILSCGCTICKKHVIDQAFKDLDSTILFCPKCCVNNDIPEKGFPSNSLAVSLLEIKLDEVHLGFEHKVAVESFNDLKELVQELKRFEENPELVIHQKFDDLRNKIDLRREEEKLKIDNEALRLIKDLDDYEKSYISNTKDKKPERFVLSKEASDLIKSLEGDLVTWESDLKKFTRDMRIWQYIHKETTSKYEQLYKESKRITPIYFTEKLTGFKMRQKKFFKEGMKPITLVDLIFC